MYAKYSCIYLHAVHYSQIGFQQFVYGGTSRKGNDNRSLPIYLNSDSFDTAKRQFPYLVPKETPKTQNKVQVQRVVAALSFRLIEHYKPFNAAGLTMIPLPVMHGEDLVCNG